MTIDQNSKTMVCQICEEGQAAIKTTNHEFQYGPTTNAVTLKAMVPFWQCDACELEYLDEKGESAMHDAVCRHLGRMTPQEMLTVRILAGCSQKEFAEKLGFGIASIKRWERGTVIPNLSTSRTVRAYREALISEKRRVPTFRMKVTEKMEAAEKAFRLRGWNEIGLPA